MLVDDAGRLLVAGLRRDTILVGGDVGLTRLPSWLLVLAGIALALAWGTHLVVALHLLWSGPLELGIAAGLAFVVETAALDRAAALVGRLRQQDDDQAL